MSELQPCEACRRHIRITEQACPFCAEQVARRSPLGSARSVILASALAGASALGCSDERPATKAPPPVDEPVAVEKPVEDDPLVAMPYGAPPPPVIADAAPVADAAPDAGAPDAAAKKKKRKAKTKVIKAPKPDPAPVPIPNMPYGAPPARHRIV